MSAPKANLSNTSLSNTQARDMASLLHPFTNLTVLRQTGPLVLDRGKGVFVYGADDIATPTTRLQITGSQVPPTNLARR